MQIGSFGETVFEVSSLKFLTFNNFKRDTAAKFAEHDVIGQVSKLEFLKRDCEKISLEIKLVADLGVDVPAETENLREICRTGESNFLIIGGAVYSDCEWIIESISESVKFFDGEGNVRVCELSLNLKEYN